MALKYDVVATTGTYQKDGETKYKTRNVGAIIGTKHGHRLKLDASFNPAGCPRDEDGQIWLALFEPNRDGPRQPQNNTQPSRGGQETPPPPDDSDIPF